MKPKYTKEIVVHQFVSYQYLIQELARDKDYKQWRQSLRSMWKSQAPDNNNTLSTVYFNSEKFGSKASKMVIFQQQQNLKVFLDVLEDGMVDTKELIANDKIFKLQYLEGMLCIT